MQRIGICLALVVAVLAAGCSFPYRPPRFESDAAHAEFPGLLDLVRQSRGGLHVVWIHGMCPHSRECWATPSALRLAQLLGADTEASTQSAVGPGGLVHRYAFQVGAKRVTADMVVWSPLIQDLRGNLCFDSALDADRDVTAACGPAASYPYPRASLNETLKSHIMNACLADAVIYVGRYGTAIRARLRAALTAVLGDGTPAGADALVFVSESLGSKILYDVVTEIMLDAGGDGQKVTARMQATRQFFMFANQIPILDLAALSAPDKEVFVADGPRSSFQDLVRKVMNEKKKEPRPVARGSEVPVDSLHVVAFTDPNDVLSYRMPQSYFGKRDDVVITNVLTSNAAVLFGFFEHPANAHSDYRKSPDAMALFACGRAAQAEPCRESVRRRMEDLPAFACANQ